LGGGGQGQEMAAASSQQQQGEEALSEKEGGRRQNGPVGGGPGVANKVSARPAASPTRLGGAGNRAEVWEGRHRRRSNGIGAGGDKIGQGT
jgi:hypothetical protein